MVRPSLFTSSPFDGTSGSWQISTNDRVPEGRSRQEKSGLRFAESFTCDVASGAQNAYSAGMKSFGPNAVVTSSIQLPPVSPIESLVALALATVRVGVLLVACGFLRGARHARCRWPTQRFEGRLLQLH